MPFTFYGKGACFWNRTADSNGCMPWIIFIANAEQIFGNKRNIRFKIGQGKILPCLGMLVFSFLGHFLFFMIFLFFHSVKLDFANQESGTGIFFRGSHGLLVLRKEKAVSTWSAKSHGKEFFRFFFGCISFIPQQFIG